MINGIHRFREQFKDYKDQYIIIGGFACDLLMTDAGLDFRQTKDVDMVIVVEAITQEFVKAFWKFIKEGGYEPYVGNHGETEFYRFVKPDQPDYPFMIELFSRPQHHVVLRPDTHLLPLHFDDDISSLSAILLNGAYYQFMVEGRTEIGDISVLGAEYIIPFKMKAWLDLSRQKELGKHVDARNLKKHRLDVFRLFPVVRSDVRIPVPEEVHADIGEFVRQMRQKEIRLTDIGLRVSKDEILDTYSRMYVVNRYL